MDNDHLKNLSKSELENILENQAEFDRETVNNAVIELNRRFGYNIEDETINGMNEDSIPLENDDSGNSFFKPNPLIIITQGIIAVNILVFIVNLAMGAGIMGPSIQQLIDWGADYGPLTLEGEYWRLLSSTFLHIGIIHIGFNMYALLFIGSILEPLLGRARFLSSYLICGIAGNILSLYWNPDIVSAGASGAVFGMFGFLLGVLIFKRDMLNPVFRKNMLRSIGPMIVINLGLGFSPGIDNAAHIGGLVSGFLLAIVYKKDLFNFQSGPNNSITAIVSLAAAAILFTALSYIPKTSSMELIKASDEIYKYQEKALKSFDEVTSNLTDQNKDIYLDKLRNDVMLNWQNALKVARSVEDLEGKSAKRQALLIEYCSLRIKEIQAFIKIVETNSEDVSELKKVRAEIGTVVEKLNDMQ